MISQLNYTLLITTEQKLVTQALQSCKQKSLVRVVISVRQDIALLCFLCHNLIVHFVVFHNETL